MSEQTYESIAAGAETPLAADPAPPAAVEPVAPPAATPPPAEEWVGPSREEWERTQQYLGETAPFLNELQSLLAEPEPQYQPQQAPQFDPANPDPYLEQRLDQMFQERFGAYEPVLGQIAEREGEQMARSTLDRLASEGGEFNRDLALVAAQLYVDPARGGMAPHEALAAAAEYARTVEAQIREDERTKYTSQLSNAANAPSDVGVPGAATPAPETPTGRDRYESVLANFRSAQNPVQPTG